MKSSALSVPGVNTRALPKQIWESATLHINWIWYLVVLLLILLAALCISVAPGFESMS